MNHGSIPSKKSSGLSQRNGKKMMTSGSNQDESGKISDIQQRLEALEADASLSLAFDKEVVEVLRNLHRGVKDVENLVHALNVQIAGLAREVSQINNRTIPLTKLDYVHTEDREEVPPEWLHWGENGWDITSY